MELLARIQKEKTNFGKQGSALRVRQVLGACQFCPDVRVTVRFSSQEAGPHVHTISPLSLLSALLLLLVSWLNSLYELTVSSLIIKSKRFTGKGLRCLPLSLSLILALKFRKCRIWFRSFDYGFSFLLSPCKSNLRFSISIGLFSGSSDPIGTSDNSKQMRMWDLGFLFVR